MTSRGGKRPGAGRPKGSKDPHTLEREAARQRLYDRVAAELDGLITAQLEAAKGAYVMFARDGDSWVRVTDPAVMERCLQSGDAFYRLEQVKPDAKLLIDTFDRFFGKPTQAVALTGAESGAITVKWLS